MYFSKNFRNAYLLELLCLFVQSLTLVAAFIDKLCPFYDLDSVDCVSHCGRFESNFSSRLV